MVGRLLVAVDVGAVNVKCLVAVAETERDGESVAVEGIGGIHAGGVDFHVSVEYLAFCGGCRIVVAGAEAEPWGDAELGAYADDVCGLEIVLDVVVDRVVGGV